MTLAFEYDNRHYSLDFNTRVLQIAGESAVGKSLMYQDLQHCMNKNATFAKQFLLINVIQNRLLSAEQRKPYKFIVIDNADLIITPEMDNEIIESTLTGSNYWILLGREPRNSVSSNSIGVLKNEKREEKHYFSIDYTTL